MNRNFKAVVLGRTPIQTTGDADEYRRDIDVVIGGRFCHCVDHGVGIDNRECILSIDAIQAVVHDGLI